MQRAIGRARQRLQGAHPRRPKSSYSVLIEIGCDVLLATSLVSMLGALLPLAWAIYAGFDLTKIMMSVGLFAIGAILLLVWERVAWEPFVDRLSHLT